ncbi:MAG: site-2 protease family protein [Planctomycetaceae bacterium]|nr:site-2 protease family protein [Planctomycetaceae bacterium]
MFGRKIPLFSLLGFNVAIDYTWFILALLISWSLAKGLFPHFYKDLPNSAYWAMGIAGAIGLFLSIVIHEFCHSLVARQFGLPMKGITLFIFGGVAEMSAEPARPRAEFLMAVVGPLSSLLLGLVFFVLTLAARRGQWPLPLTGVLAYLMWLNVVLALFNMIPAFPLDGGRVLRSILWSIKGDVRWATRIAAATGSAFGMLLILWGVLAFVTGNVIGGVWYFLIGLFIRNAARMSYQQMVIRQALAGESVQSFMTHDPITVPPDETIQGLIENFIYKYHHKMFPVTEDGRLKGCVSTRQVRNVPNDQRGLHTVKEIIEPCSSENTIGPETDAMEAMSLMSKTGISRLMVVKGDRLEGILTLKDLLKFLSLKIDLEGGEKVNLAGT